MSNIEQENDIEDILVVKFRNHSEKVVERIANKIADKRDEKITSILKSMGVTKEYIQLHRSDFHTELYGERKKFFYRNINLFDEFVVRTEDLSVEYWYDIYFVGDIKELNKESEENI